MNFQTLATVGVSVMAATATVATQWNTLRKGSRLRSELKADAELVKLLEGEAKEKLRKHLDQRIARLVELESGEMGRDRESLAIAALLLALAAGGSWAAMSVDGFWPLLFWPPTVAFAVLGMVGLMIGLQVDYHESRKAKEAARRQAKQARRAARRRSTQGHRS